MTRAGDGAARAARLPPLLLPLLLALTLALASPPFAAAQNIEFGHLKDVTSNWQTVTFSSGIVNPLVFAKAPTDNEKPDPCTPLIRNVQTGSFEIKLVEPLRRMNSDNSAVEEVLDQIHSAEEVSYVVIPEGESVDTTASATGNGDSLRIRAGTVTTSAYSQNVIPVDEADFNNGPPMLLSMVQTINYGEEDTLMATRQEYNSGATTAYFELMHDEVRRGSAHGAAETIAWALISPGVFEVDAGSSNIEVLVEVNTDDAVIGTHIKTDKTMPGLTALLPDAEMEFVLANMQTDNGGDSSWLRRGLPAGLTVGLFVEEGQSANSEQSHTTERFGMMALVCGASTLSEGVSPTFANTAIANGCQSLYARYAPAVPVPYVVVTFTLLTGTGPTLFMNRGTTAPSEIDFDVSDVTGAPSVSLALPDVGSDGVTLALVTGGASLSYTLTVALPPVTALGLASAAAASTVNEWSVFSFAASSVYTALEVVVTPPPGGEPLELYAAKFPETVETPTAVPSTYDDATAAIDPGTGNYLLSIGSPAQGRELRLSVRSPGASGVSFIVEVRPAQPEVTTASAPSGAPTSGGAQLQFTGTNFGDGDEGSTTVTVGGEPCTDVVVDSVSGSCTLPEGQGAAQVVVTHFGIASNPVAFAYDGPEVTSQPQIVNGVISTTRPATDGTSVMEISGVNFGLAGAGNTVTVGGTVCDPVPGQWDHTLVQCTVRPGQGQGLQVVVTVGAVPSPGSQSVSYIAPRLTEVLPALQPASGVVPLTLRGDNFGVPSNGVTEVSVAGEPCAVLSQTQTEVQCDLAAGGGTGLPITLRVASQDFTNVNALTVSYERPLVTGFPVSSGATGGERITLLGSNFGTEALGAVVSFGAGGEVCTPVSHNDSVVICDTPEGQGVGLPVRVVFGGQQSVARLFSFDAPFIGSLASPDGLPAAGAVNLTLIGTSFGAGGGITVTANSGDPCAVLEQDHSRVVCILPSGVGTAREVRAEVALQPSNVRTYDYEAPDIDLLTVPSNSTEGTYLLTLTGSNFGEPGSGARVTIGGTLCVEETFADDELQCTVSAGTGENLAVVVTVGDQRSDDLGEEYFFSYGAPEVNGSLPAEASTSGGSILAVSGSNFGPAGVATVEIGGEPASVTAYGHNQLLVQVPEGRGEGLAVEVTVGSRSDSLASFSYAAPELDPIAAGNYPTGGGVLLFLSGTSLDTGGRVLLGVPGGGGPYRECEQLSASTSWDHEAIVCDLPAGEGENVDVIVETAGLRNSTAQPLSYNAPFITEISVDGPVTTTGAGLTLLVTGNSLGLAGVVAVGSRECLSPVFSHTSVSCQLPEGQGTQLVSVTVGAQTSNSKELVRLGPTLGGVTPTSGAPAGGSNITLDGSNFGVDGEVTVLVGTSECVPFLPQAHDEIVCVLPPGQGTTAVRVTVSGRSSDLVPFQYTGPTLDSVDPPGGPAAGGTTIVLTGTDFGSSGTVRVGSRVCAQASPTPVYNDTYIECVTPPGQGLAAAVTVTVEEQGSESQPFDYDAPVVNTDGSGVLPATGGTAGGTTVVVRGANFGESGTVQIGGVTCTQEIGVTLYNDSQIECVMPAGQGAGLAVRVEVSLQQSPAAPAVLWSYAEPTISGITGQGGPTTGSTAGSPAQVVIAGANLGTSGAVLVGGTPCSVVRPDDHTHDSITCSLPPGQGSVDVNVTVSGQGASSAGGYTYGAPLITDVRPLAGPTDAAGGAVVITVEGSNFGAFGSLTVGGRLCNTSEGAPSAVHTSTRMECRLPDGEGGAQAVAVDVSGLTDTYTDDDFAYFPPVAVSATPPTLPTLGQTGLVLTGTNFGRDGDGAASVTVGGQVCTITARSYDTIVCDIAAGVGAGLELDVQVAGQGFVAANFTRRTAPSITALVDDSGGGCVDDGAGSLKECGNDDTTRERVKITGENFGELAGDVSVEVDGDADACTGVTVSAHQEITCNLRGGVGVDRELVVLVDGEPSNAVLFSYQVPEITPLTLRVLGQPVPSSGTHTAAGITGLGSVNLIFDGRFLREGSSQSRVRYGTPGRSFADMEFEANVLNTAVDSITFTMEEGGVGGGYAFIVNDTVQLSRESDDRISYATPRVEGGTLRLSAPEAGGATSARGSQNQQDVWFEASFIGTNASRVRVFYGGSPAAPAYDNECTIASLTAAADPTQTTVACRTQDGEGDGYHFVVEVGNTNTRSAPGDDTYNFPANPQIDSVDGCARVTADGFGTEGCLTAGGDQITIHGSNFTNDPGAVSVKIGNGDCAPVVVTGTTVVECTTPPGTGARLSVLVISGNRFSTANEFISYEAPSIDGIEGCGGGGAASPEVRECLRAGGQRLTITGTNFGASDATVLVSGVECTNVTHAAGSTAAHGTVYCDTPPGTRTERTVLLLQNRGELSSNFVRLSYEQCPAGFRDVSPAGADVLECESCPPGRVSDTEGLTECTRCDPGFYAERANMTRCEDCLRGTFSVLQADGNGPVECTDCPEGEFTASDRQDSCEPCPAGTFQTGFGRTVCQACAPGTSNGGTGQTVCGNCTAGSFSAEGGALDCDLCPAGRFTGAGGLSACDPCQPGEYHPGPGATECFECPKGTATGASAQAICTPCGSGFFANVTNLDACLPCASGSASVAAPGSPTGPTGCVLCPDGEYNAFEGQATCLLCGRGTYESGVGSTECERCELGRFANSIGQTECDLCAAGRLASSLGTVLCSACTTGRFANDTGFSECDPCPAGTFQELPGLSFCDDCAAGSVTTSLAQPLCQPCEAGDHAPADGLDACVPCAAGKIAALGSATECTGCGPGTFSASSGQAVCDECAPGRYGDGSNLTSCTLCEPGTVQDDTAGETCNNCSAGTISAGAGGRTCETCPDGTHAPADGLDACVSCLPGQFQDGSDPTKCEPCDFGEFAPAVGQPRCQQCPPGQFANATGMSFCHVCAAGRFQRDPGTSFCDDCLAGSFTGAEGQASCIQCVEGRAAPLDGASECGVCAAGSRSGSSATVCTNCTEGRFSASDGSSVCEPCASGRVNSGAGLTACDACDAGRFQPDTEQLSCDPCAAGSVQPSGGQPSCRSCDPGEYQTEEAEEACLECPVGRATDAVGTDTECANCTEGRFAGSEGTVTCSPCSPGRYAPVGGLSECVQCEAGRYQPAGERDTCIVCALGRSTSSRGQTLCPPCEAGTFANDTEQETCQACPPGTQSGAEASECTPCIAGRFSDISGFAECSPCIDGFYQPEEGKTRCERCGPGTFASTTGQSFCENCTAGSAAPGTGSQACATCGLGRFSAADAADECVACPAGTFQDSPGSSGCKPCGTGRFTAEDGQADCNPCRAGFVAPAENTTACTACVPGKFQSDQGRAECDECLLGQAIGAEGQVQCLECEPGRFANVTDLDACINCPPGTFSVKRPALVDGDPPLGAIECSPCPRGSFSTAEGQSACPPCGLGTHAPNLGMSACDRCGEGTHAPIVGSVVCQGCSEGRFSAGLGASECDECPPGRAEPEDDSTECGACQPGSYQSEFEKTECTQCEPGRFNEAPLQSDCFDCPIGRFGATSNLTDCTDCLPGSAQGSEGRDECDLCLPGFWQDAPGLASCKRCPPGSYSNTTGAEECTECEVGRFQLADAQTECLPCFEGTVAPREGQSVCDSCAPGKFMSDRGQANCTDCSAGTVQPALGQVACVNCSAGEFIADAGLEFCRECPAGTVSRLPGATVCDDCSPGTFQERVRQSDCDECPAGRATNADGQTQCQICDVGEFQNETGTTSCERCAPGSIQPSTEQTSCTVCRAGSISRVLGLTRCEDCPVGRFQPNDFQTACLACAPGFVQPDSGQTVCDGCITGRFQGDEGQGACLDCEAGSVQALENSTECDPCAAGRFQPAQAQTSCIDCAAGQAQPNQGGSACLLCAPGTVHAVPGKAGGVSSRYPANAQCDACEEGRVVLEPGGTACTRCGRGEQVVNPADRTECEACPPLTFASSAGTDECVRCEEDSVPNEDRTECRCRSGTYGFTCVVNSTTDQPDRCAGEQVANLNRVCVGCPEGALCDDEGVEFETLASEAGFWCGRDTWPPRFYRCLIRGHCESGACSAGSTAAAELQEGSQCADHRTGPICAVCEDGYTATTVTSACEECPDRTESLVSTVGIGVVILVVLTFMYWVVLRSDRDLMEDAKKRAEHKKENQWAWFEEDESIDDPRRRALFSNQYERGQGGPVAVPNFMYKMKILLGFFQITSSITIALDVPWPTTYQKFIAVFSIVNFDLISWSNAGCLVEVNYETTLVVFTVTPVAVMLIVMMVYLLPRYLRHQQDDYDLRRAARDRSTKQFWKLFLFTLFLIYPSVSSTVVRVFVCREIENENYLLADMSIICGSPKWQRMAIIAAAGVVVYALGIPVYFYWLLKSHRGTLHLPETRIQLGFLYEAYSPSLWFFELVDMGNKLFMVAVLGFLPQNVQLGVGMGWTILYLITLLLSRPYLRLGDDRLHLFVQAEIFILLLAAHVLLEEVELTESTDLVMSALLIGLTAGLMLFFVVQVAFVANRMIKRRKDKKVAEAEARKNAALAKNNALSHDVTGLRMPKDAQMTRNPLFDGTSSNLHFDAAEERIELADFGNGDREIGRGQADAAYAQRVARQAGEEGAPDVEYDEGGVGDSDGAGAIHGVKKKYDDLDQSVSAPPMQSVSAPPGAQFDGGDDEDESDDNASIDDVITGAATDFPDASDDEDDDDEDDDDFGATSFAPRKSQSRHALI